jgi:hypothetical protein
MAFEEGLPRALWGDIIIAFGVVALAYELYKLATFGIGANTLAQIQDGIFFIMGIILISAGGGMKT